MKPIINYDNSKFSQKINVPMPLLKPINTGGAVLSNLSIATVSGNSNNTDYPKDGLPYEATYKFPNSVSSKPNGTLVVVDDWSQTIRIIEPSGISRTLAGKYEIGAPFADGQGENARFNTPTCAAFDSAGNVIVLDTYNYRVRKITPSGLVTTLSGTGIIGSADGIGTIAQFNMLTSLWIDSKDNIFVTDRYRVRKITPNGTVTTIAGNYLIKGFTNGTGTIATFKNMRGITGDNLGNVYVADAENNSIRKINLGTSNVTTFVKGINPSGIAYSEGTVYFSDWMENKIKQIKNGGAVEDYAGSGSPEFKDGFNGVGTRPAALYAPEGIAIDENKVIYVADKNSMKIRKVCLSNYVINPELPKGLKLDPITGAIYGTPIEKSAIKVYRVSAGNADGFVDAFVILEVK